MPLFLRRQCGRTPQVGEGVGDNHGRGPGGWDGDPSPHKTDGLIWDEVHAASTRRDRTVPVWPVVWEV